MVCTSVLTSVQVFKFIVILYGRASWDTFNKMT